VNNRIVLPGSRIGVLGSGQLGRMFAIAARRMGYRVHTYSPDADSPTGHVADEEFCGSYTDLDAVRNFAAGVHVVTFEFENVPAATAAACAELVPVRPRGEVLHTTQNRLREKTALQAAGIPVTPFVEVHSADELRKALAELGVPAILKTAGWGYDGKGQVRIAKLEEADAAWLALDCPDGVLEAFVPFKQEVSVVAARGMDGAFVHYPVVENVHRNHILDTTVCPANVDPVVHTEAAKIARRILDQLDVVGVLCVEFFLRDDNTLLVNELAPRPHNSGHLTFDASVTSQFEQQLRAVCGLPLGAPDLLRPAAMANLLGGLWANGEPNWAAALHDPRLKLHLYGKQDARDGRKMGHLTAMADTPEEALRLVTEARERLR
jgi:5-(carboxyamino)imidazole ribonucleotide synthase